MSGTLCLVTTVRAPGESFASFLRYHLAIGVAQIIVFCDDPQDPAIAVAAAFGPAVTVIPADEALYKRYATLQTATEPGVDARLTHTFRQIHNAEIAIGMAMAAGHQWLLHLDADELFFCPTGTVADHLAVLEAEGVDMATYANFEAVPNTMEVSDPFREVSYFKINPSLLPKWQMRCVVEYWLPQHRYYFTAYVDGKAMVRLQPGVLPHGRHRFRLFRGEMRCLAFNRPLILHYAHCGLATYTAKFAHLATSPATDTMVLPFYRRSVAAWQQGGAEALLPLYEQTIMIPVGELLMLHLGDQTIGRFKGPQRILAEIAAGALS
jgi:hypothetical protein